MFTAVGVLTWLFRSSFVSIKASDVDPRLMKSSVTSPTLVCMAVLLKLQRPPGLGTAA